MRILVLTNFYPPAALGGLEMQCHEVMEQLLTRGHQISILTSRFRRDRASSGEQDVVCTLHLQSEDVDYYQPLSFFLSRGRRERENERELLRAIASFDPDLVFVWGMWNLSWRLPRLAEELLPGKVAYAIAGYWPMEPDSHETYWRLKANHPISEALKTPARWLALRQLASERNRSRLEFRHVTVCSEHVKDELVAGGMKPERIRVIYNGIAVEPFREAAAMVKCPVGRPLELLYFGRVLDHKGVHTVVEALGELGRRGCAPLPNLTILGGGHPIYLAHLRDLSKRLMIEEHVTFVGDVSRDQIPRRIQPFDVFTFTSIYAEPFGRTIIEAMAAGLVVIGSRVGGSMEILSDYDADLLYEPGNARELADRIQFVMMHPDRMRGWIAAGRKLVESRFTLEHMVDEIEAWLQEIVA